MIITKRMVIQRETRMEDQMETVINRILRINQIRTAPPPCGNCGLNNHRTSECKKPKGGQGNTSNNNVICFQCKQVGHKRSQCPTLKANGPHQTAAAMQQLTSVPVNGTDSRHQCDNSHGEGEIELACGCKVPVVAGAWSADGQLKLKEWSSHVVRVE